MKTSQTTASGDGGGAGNRPGGAKSPLMLSSYIIFSISLFLIILLTGGSVFLFSLRQIMRENKGRELTRLMELERMKLESSVSREIAVVLKMATSPLIKRYFESPDDPELRKMAGEEMDAYRQVLTGSTFWVMDADKLFHFNDREPYLINPALPENYWYNMTMNETESYNFNINYNPDVKETNLWINAPVFNDSLKAIGILGTGVDLTAFIGAIYGVYRSHSNAHFYFFNAAEEITGADDIKLVARKKNIRDQLGSVGTYVAGLSKALRPGEVQTFATRNGQVAVISIPMLEWFAVAVLPDTIDDFKTPLLMFFCLGILVIAFILVLSNIFIARLLKPLRETMASLESASQAKTEFLAKMSHEIRTPMNAIMGLVQIQQHKGGLSEDVKAAFDKIYNSSTLLLGIINDILDMSKIETGRLELHPIEYDVPSLIDDSVQFNIVRVGSKPIEFKLFVDEKLPARLYGDELRLKQILNNILSNSFKYTDKGAVSLTVSHMVEDDHVNLIMQIKDTGQGIKEEDLQLLFSEYQRFNVGINRNTEGTGLGLNITKRLVAMMDGRIEVESVYGKGSTFTVTVKQKPIPHSGVIGTELSKKLREFTFTSLKQSEAQQITRKNMGHGKALVVDDVEINLIVAEGLLTPYGLQVEKAWSGFSAIDFVRSGKSYDIIFMDHMMPKMDGVETTKKLRELGYHGTIVALTANAIVGNEEMFANCGFDGFLSKPVDVRELDAILNRFVSDRHPEETAKAKADIGAPRAVKLSERFLKALKNDARRALAVLRDANESGDIKTFTTTVHGLKSAFAAIGEMDKSQQALDLEVAGRNQNREFIAANIDRFIEALEELVKDE